MSQRSEGRRKLAEGLGLGYEICHPDKLKEKFSKVKAEVDGFDIIVDCSGNPDAIQDAFKWLCMGGKINVYGCCPKVKKNIL